MSSLFFIPVKVIYVHFIFCPEFIAFSESIQLWEHVFSSNFREAASKWELKVLVKSIFRGYDIYKIV